MAAMKMYDVNGSTFWFHDGDAPKGAKEVKQAKTTQNRGRAASNKDASAAKADKAEAAEGRAE